LDSSSHQCCLHDGSAADTVRIIVTGNEYFFVLSFACLMRWQAFTTQSALRLTSTVTVQQLFDLFSGLMPEAVSSLPVKERTPYFFSMACH
jgi:hypothetical protein